MQIKILDSWLREYLETNATARDIAKALSLSSVSVERLEKVENDFLYDIEITTNRADLMSVIGLAREAGAVLPEAGFKAIFKEPRFQETKDNGSFPIEIRNDPKLVNRICAVVLNVTAKKSSTKLSKRLEASGIRSLNNLIDVTNYVMRQTGHPAHVFDFDKLSTNKLIIRESKPDEKITTLDNKEYSLLGKDIVMEDQKGRIVDLLGIMGLSNSIVSDNTKKILFFLDNNEPKHIRNTSMALGIRTEAAVLNEKYVDPNLAIDALYAGIDLYKELADATVASPVLDIFPNKPESEKINLSLEKIDKIIGEKVTKEKSKQILTTLGFNVAEAKDTFLVKVPSFRSNDVSIEEDLIEEIARVYGYQNLKSVLPPENQNKKFTKFDDTFYWESRAKTALKYWGLTEVYTYSLISEELYLGPPDEAIKIKNPLSSDMLYLRNSLIPSLIKVSDENKKVSNFKIFELANTYHKLPNKLPIEKLTLAGLFRKTELSFFEVKGIIEGLFMDLGIDNASFKTKSGAGSGADIYISQDYLGYLEVLGQNIMDFEIDFNKVLKHATLKRKLKPIAKYPPIIEDLTLVVENLPTAELIENIKMQNKLISEVKLLGEYSNKKTVRIVYQSLERSLTKEEVGKLRREILEKLKTKFNILPA